jgi:hypothetical protein
MSTWTDMSGWLGNEDEINYNTGVKNWPIKKCLIKLTYLDKTSKRNYVRYHIMALNLDESIEDQIYNKYGNLTPMYIDFKWQEINL